MHLKEPIMKTWPIATCLGAFALAACATTGEDGGSGGACEAEAAQRFVGEKATADIGAAVLRATGAKQLRWGPPRSAMTMDFRPDRVTVAYDDAMTIERITCG
jgi:hypothetical protein